MLLFITLLLFLTVSVIALCRKFNLPAILGYLTVGVLLHFLLKLSFLKHFDAELISTGHLAHLAEFGVVFLMFSIGLEFSLPKLKAMKKEVFGLGTLQVFGSIIATFIVGFLLQRWLYLSWQATLILGSSVAMSSTAIVTKLLAEKQELTSEHGKAIVGILLFQDLIAVPLLILIPILSKPLDSLVVEMSIGLLKVAGILVLLLGLAQKPLQKWLHHIAKFRSQELFMLNVLLITLGLACSTEMLGLSMAMGAFVAGMLLSETQYVHQIEEDIKPFREVLLGLFFVTVGLLVDITILLEQWYWVLLFLVGPLVGKWVLITGLAKLLKIKTSVGLKTGLWLAQAGEFGFVLLQLSETVSLNQSSQHLEHHFTQAIIGSMLLSMMISPLLIQHSQIIILKISKKEWLTQSVQFHDLLKNSLMNKDTVIIGGYGTAGKHLASIFRLFNISYKIVEHDPDKIEQGQACCENIVYGNIYQTATWKMLGVQKIKCVILTPHAAMSLVEPIEKILLELNPNIQLFAYDERHSEIVKNEIPLKNNINNTILVSEKLEGALMMGTNTLLKLGFDVQKIEEKMADYRYEKNR
jgi:CPA2 family monovalent cation:H+ antiporter-2